MTAPEFSRPQPIDAIGEVARAITIEADRAECEALAQRFDLIEVTRLAATLSLTREAAGIRAQGRVTGAVIQACTVTGDPVPAAIDEPVALLFAPDSAANDSEIELSAEALDVIPYRGAAIDLGEAAAETMALALDPFPRGPQAEAALRAAGVLQEGEVKPIGPLAGLRDQLEKRS